VFARPETLAVAQSFVDTMEYNAGNEAHAPNYDGDSDEPEHAAAARSSVPRRRKNSPKRCRKCGKEYAHIDWKEFHLTPTASSGNLRTNDIKIWDVCTVLEEHYEPGFPFLDTSRNMPRRRRTKRSRAT
jgi:hypothetical protein